MVSVSADSKPILQMKGISRAFPGVQALDDVSFDLYPGEVHVLVGENGAGKSTLMKILAGAYEKDKGDIVIDGEIQHHWSTATSRAKGVAMVYQEFNLVPFRSVAENIFLGHEKLRGPFLDKAAMHREANAQMEAIGVPVDTHTPVGRLGVAQQQMVEIAKALLLDVRILVLDEPTSALTVREIDQLFGAIRRLKARGVGIIYISHRMEEVSIIGDRITVLRDGQYIGTRKVAEITYDEIVKMMVGREIKDLFPRHYREPGEVALRISGLCTKDKLREACFQVRAGEIVGLAGLVGAGRTETARAIFGLDPPSAGSVEINGVPVTRLDPPKAVDMGIGLAPEDRRRDGLFPILPMKSNIIMSSLRALFPSGILKPAVEQKVARKYADMLRIQPPGLERQVRYLSGGNQQKVVVAKWLAVGPKVLIFDEPTRGIDVGAKAEIHAFMDQLANEGHAILMISSELPEIIGMSDRIYVMHEGRVVGELPRGANSEQIIRLAMGMQA
jgi:ribose transport system ATP-binding protein